MGETEDHKPCSTTSPTRRITWLLTQHRIHCSQQILPSHLDPDSPRRQSSCQRLKSLISFSKEFSKWVLLLSKVGAFGHEIGRPLRVGEMPTTGDPLKCVIVKGSDNKRKDNQREKTLQVLVLWSHGCHGDFVPANFIPIWPCPLLDPLPTSPIVQSCPQDYSFSIRN